MDWASRNKMKWYAGFGLIALIMIGYFVYITFIRVVPTCSDGKQNQNERGIDCGGICARVCSFDAKTIVPLWSRAFPITKGVYNVVAYIENQNQTAGTRKINYEFRVYDEDNILAAEPITGSAFVGPNDRTAIFETPVLTGNRIPKNVFFRFTENPIWEKVDVRYQVPQLMTSNIILTEEDTAPKLTATINNETLFSYQDIEIIALLYNDVGNVLQVSKTHLDIIAEQTSENIYFTWPEPLKEKVARIEIISRINPFIQND